MENIVTREISVTDLRAPATFTSGGFEPRCFSWAHVREGVIWFHLLGCCVRILTSQSQCSVQAVGFWQDDALFKDFGLGTHYKIFHKINFIRSSRLKFSLKFVSKKKIIITLHLGFLKKLPKNETKMPIVSCRLWPNSHQHLFWPHQIQLHPLQSRSGKYDM